jgi:transitional endoplasmic reticulum ATPase
MDLDANGSSKTQDEQKRIERTLLDTLAQIGGRRVTDDDLKRQGKQLILPETMSPEGAIDYLTQHIAQQEEETRFDRTFRYRPHDGANALQQALLKVFGTAGLGKATWTFFSRIPPEMISISDGPNSTRQVPWGKIELPIIQGEMYLTQDYHPEWGQLFNLIIDAPRKHRAVVEGLFIAVEEELRTGSIYRGHPIDGQETPEFLDLRGVSPDKVIYSDEVTVQLSASLWSLLRYTDNMRREDLPLKRSVLLAGPYGCGKTLAAFLTAKIAEENGWTFIYCRPAKDDLDTVMTTAKLYQPAVVFFEDVDVLAESGEKDSVTRLLDMFDGISSKGTEIVAVLTTNHVEKIHKAMLRPGRLDALIPIEGLDRNGIERMVRAHVPADQLESDIDFDAVAEAMDEYLPAFVKESIDRARRFSLDRNEGVPGTLTTDDLVYGAEGLRAQLDLMNEADEGHLDDRLSTALGRVFERSVDGVQVEREPGETWAQLATPRERLK